MSYSGSKDNNSSRPRQLRGQGYRPQLDEFITQCELNYILLLRLLPELDRKMAVKQGNGFPDSDFGHWRFDRDELNVSIQLVEQSPYTTTLEVKICGLNYQPDETCKENNRQQRLLTRVYHDANLFEVMDGPQPRAMQAKQKQPNMHQREADEKRQLNRFLGENLKYMLSTYEAIVN